MVSGSLTDKVVIVVGAGGAQGSVTAELLVREGAKVVAADVSPESLAAVASAIGNTGACTTTTVDVTSEESWQSLVALATQTYGRVDGFVNFAGILARSGFEDTSVEVWHRVLEVNLTGAWLGIKTVVPALRASGGGSIVNIGTVDSLIGKGVTPAYQASKGGLRMMSKNAATKYAPENIRVNCVHPGAMEDRMRNVLGAPSDPSAVAATMEDLRAHTPLRRLGTPLDIAYAVRFLLSDESSFITGIDLPVDGGYSVP